MQYFCFNCDYKMFILDVQYDSEIKLMRYIRQLCCLSEIWQISIHCNKLIKQVFLLSDRYIISVMKWIRYRKRELQKTKLSINLDYLRLIDICECHIQLYDGEPTQFYILRVLNLLYYVSKSLPNIWHDCSNSCHGKNCSTKYREKTVRPQDFKSPHRS